MGSLELYLNIYSLYYMHMKRFYSILILIIASCSLHAIASPGIVVNNRILVTVNEKTISVLDIMKKMNVVFTQTFPQYANSPEARFEFFSTQWKGVLAQMIDQELILADAEKLEISIKDADLRENLQERFGPNVVANLESLGITYDEAREMIRTDLIVQRMTWFRIHSKAILKIHPKDIKGAYQDYCMNNTPQDEWKYQSLAIRSSNPEAAEQLSEQAYHLLQQGKLGLAAVAKELQERAELPEDTAITLSEEFCVADKELSSSHKNVLTSLEPGSYSQPLEQVSRDKTPLKRIFHLKEHTKKELPKFEQLADKLEDQLVHQAVMEETSTYVYKLRRRFGFDEQQLLDLPASFQPFVFTGHASLQTQ